MRDQLDRPLRDLRISVTDRCNLRCVYCMPKEVFGAGYAFLPRGELLSFEEIARVARVLAAQGVDKLRLTGGEPLLRRNLERLVEMLAGIEGIEDVALTTNGLLLAGKARSLADAGLSRVTVSLDALDDDTLHAVSDAPISATRVLDGIDAAAAAGLSPVKVNMVVRRGVNEDCVVAMAERFRHSDQVVRFIEYMDVGSTNGWTGADVVPAAEILERIAQRWPLEPLAPTRAGEVATRYRYRDGAGEIGLIHSVSAPFCASCARARLSADGKLFTCLFARSGHDLRALLRGSATDREIAERTHAIWSARADRYSAERAERYSADSAERAEREQALDEPAKVEMSYIGG
ncbi:MAG: molybdenum cofactor biosynthesis protein MoeA [Solirubrobacterales bacterium]|nr:molybdenum cofactor biosynthesis protein MoeA [Solirubrobacterales bacterium]